MERQIENEVDKLPEKKKQFFSFSSILLPKWSTKIYKVWLTACVCVRPQHVSESAQEL